MDIRAALLQEHSKAQILKIFHYVASSPERFKELWDLFIHDEYRVVQRASWAVNYCVEQDPSLIADAYEDLDQCLKKPAHDAVKRNILRMLQFVSIPEAWQGTFYEHAFNYATNPKEPVAIRVFALQVLWDITKEVPELLPELKLVLDDCAKSDRAGMQSRIRKIRKEIARQAKKS